jgi:hypothetical protein
VFFYTAEIERWGAASAVDGVDGVVPNKAHAATNT